MIGVIVAMEKELAALKLEAVEQVQIGGLTFYQCKLYGHEAVVAVCGIGKVAAAMCAEAMILRFSPEWIINCGVAGSLSADLHVLDIAVAEGAVQYDMDTTALGDPPGWISGINKVILPCDAKMADGLYKAAAEAGLHAQKGLIASADRFCAEENQKAEIVQNFHAIACEMEGGAVAHVCYVNDVPCALFRAISDSANDEANLTYAEFTSRAAENAARVLACFLNHIAEG